MYIFFFNDTATTEIYTLSLHDALPIYVVDLAVNGTLVGAVGINAKSPSSDYVYVANPSGTEQTIYTNPDGFRSLPDGTGDRKSTRLNSSHANISYAVFCLKKKKKYV